MYYCQMILDFCMKTFEEFICGILQKNNLVKLFVKFSDEKFKSGFEKPTKYSIKGYIGRPQNMATPVILGLDKKMKKYLINLTINCLHTFKIHSSNENLNYFMPFCEKKLFQIKKNGIYLY